MKKIQIALATIFGLLILVPATVSAQKVDVFDEVCNGQRGGSSAACKDKEAGQRGNPIYGPDGLITKIINVISIIVGIAAVVAIIMAGLKLITSGSNPQDVTTAREMILYAVVGLILVALAQAIVRFFINRVIAT